MLINTGTADTTTLVLYIKQLASPASDVNKD